MIRKGPVVLLCSTGIGYTIQLNVYGDDRFYERIFYNEAGSTSIKARADIINADTPSVSIELLKQNKISGTVRYQSENFEWSKFCIRLYTQLDTNIRNSIYITSTVVSSNIYTNNDNIEYSFFAPSDMENYIIGISKSRQSNVRYYTHDRLVEDIDNAEIISVTGDVSGVDIDYVNYDPEMPIVIADLYSKNFGRFSIQENKNSEDELHIILKNMSDYLKEDLNVYVAFYDEYDRMIRMHYGGRVYVDAGKYTGLSVLLPVLEEEITKCKIFVWDDNMTQFSDQFEREES